MTETFLHKIFEVKKRRVEKQKYLVDMIDLKERAFLVRSSSSPHKLQKALERPDKINIIAEIKRASPSKGIINDNIDVAAVAASYEKGGACAVSVLTEEDFFKGSLDDLKRTRAAIDLPILRKDFVFDEFQIYESAEAGADVILLIVAMLDDMNLEKLYHTAHVELGLDVLVEVHTLEELRRAEQLEANIIGVNNRDLHSFNVSIDVSRDLIHYKPLHSLMISESGITTKDEILELHKSGFNGFLIGETLMRSEDPASMLEFLQ